MEAGEVINKETPVLNILKGNPVTMPAKATRSATNGGASIPNAFFNVVVKADVEAAVSWVDDYQPSELNDSVFRAFLVWKRGFIHFFAFFYHHSTDSIKIRNFETTRTLPGFGMED